MSDQGPTSGSDGSYVEGHWFAGKAVDVLIYRVNRRPLSGEPMLFFEERPEDVLAHLHDILGDLQPVKSGRRFQRDWRLGNKTFDAAAGVMTAQLGYSRAGETIGNVWDEETQSWTDWVVQTNASAVAPLAFVRDDDDVESRFLGVLRHPSFEEDTVAWVLTEMLNRAEHRNRLPRVEWAVEPVGDPKEFYEWLRTTDQVTELQFVFKRPNPDGEESFLDLFQRLDLLEADKIRENITARDPNTGLNKAGLMSDSTTRGFIAAAMAAFGFVVGKGRRRGKKVRYDQRQKALRQKVEDVSPEWDAATEDVLNAVRTALRRR